MIRRSAWRNTLSIAGGDLALGRREAGDLGVRGVGEEEVDALLPSRAKARRSVSPAVERQLVHLEVAGVQQGAAGGAHRDGERVRDRVVDRDELAVEDAEQLPVALAHAECVGPDPVLLELGLDERGIRSSRRAGGRA